MQLIYSGKIQFCHSMFHMNYLIEGRAKQKRGQTLEIDLRGAKGV